MKKVAFSSLKGGKIVLGVTGCIAAYKACDLTSRLSGAGAEVRVVMTRSAQNFVTPLTFRVLSEGAVFTDLFEAPLEFDPVHISLAKWPELIVIAPATANVIGKIACGIADDLLTCTVMAARVPILIAPAMNEGMWENPAVRENVARLKKRGCHFVGPERGRLACGGEGVGRLADIETILESIKNLL